MPSPPPVPDVPSGAGRRVSRCPPIAIVPVAAGCGASVDPPLGLPSVHVLAAEAGAGRHGTGRRCQRGRGCPVGPPDAVADPALEPPLTARRPAAIEIASLTSGEARSASTWSLAL